MFRVWAKDAATTSVHHFLPCLGLAGEPFVWAALSMLCILDGVLPANGCADNSTKRRQLKQLQVQTKVHKMVMSIKAGAGSGEAGSPVEYRALLGEPELITHK